ncbi:reverse transcriptase domain-containing protein [Mesorhizobium sp. B2-4-6]|uniref:reverse transcriptase domain-containing protein n=1 Tax=Mesorhizobium sp. B2-4-6 TaxID=2589943 RepID=UPI00112D6C66|nr:reverse transcriptase domain-containing protein [Mesorhizobium sp. B2-4-6]TPL49826.1 hypothetical protein FJ957_12250 [Mesorhizobium sp. B2-4-6]
MSVLFETYRYSYLRKGKPVFVPSERGQAIGYALKEQIEAAVEFDQFLYHLRRGGHVAALHAHRQHRYFARIDIERFFYGIGRNRVARALAEIGIAKAGEAAKWSCVRNPYGEPRYALPYGFVQSPILATLVLMRSPVGAFLRDLPVTASVYMDDISLSGDDKELLDTAFARLLQVLEQSNFALNKEKTQPPAEAVALFHCDLTHQHAAVKAARKAEFYSIDRSAASASAFERYCDGVANGNAPAA